MKDEITHADILDPLPCPGWVAYLVSGSDFLGFEPFTVDDATPRNDDIALIYPFSQMWLSCYARSNPCSHNEHILVLKFVSQF